MRIELVDKTPFILTRVYHSEVVNFYVMLDRVDLQEIDTTHGVQLVPRLVAYHSDWWPHWWLLGCAR